VEVRVAVCWISSIYAC